MPVLLAPKEYDLWLRGVIWEVHGFQFRKPVLASRIEIERTDDLWRSGALPVQRQLF